MLGVVLLVVSMLASGYVVFIYEIYYCLAGLVLAVDLSSMVMRWLTVVHYKKHQSAMLLDAAVMLKLMPRARIKIGLSIVLLLIFGLLFSSVRFSTYLGFALWFVALEMLVYYMVNKGKFRIGISDTTLFGIAPKMVAVNLISVKMIDRKYDDLYVYEKNGGIQVLPIEGLESTVKNDMMQLLKKKADEHGFHITEAVTQVSQASKP